ncbi:MAG: pilus assembly protein [Desulfuromonas sp.]|nr:pilus assembly protein [Desulfuromonas sp.]
MKKRSLQNERGATMVEFAIIVALLLTIVFGIIEFSVLLYNKHMLTNASREGARAGVVMRVPRLPDTYTMSSGDKVGVKDIVLIYCQQHLVTFGDSGEPLDYDDIDVVPDDRTGAEFGDELVVTVTFDFDFLVLDNLAGLGPITLTAETRMKME